MNSQTTLDHTKIKQQIVDTIDRLKEDRDATYAKIGSIDVLFMKTDDTITCCPKCPDVYWSDEHYLEYEQIFDSMNILFSGATKGDMLSFAFNMID